MPATVFIDGEAGTTGLEIRERLAGRSDIRLISLPGERRKDAAARADALNEADVSILCLPDEAAVEAVGLLRNPRARVIDASTAHRVAPGWVYGFPELKEDQAQTIAQARLVSNPGCYPTGFLALARPLVARGAVPADWPFTVNAVSGYTGGGKAMIARFEGPEAAMAPAHHIYATRLGHKHLPEMQVHAGLVRPPIFAPSVARTPRGMIVEVPLALWALPGRPALDDIHAILTDAYRGGGGVISVAPLAESLAGPALAVEDLAGSDAMRLFVFGDRAAGQARLVAQLDNLGKGASGAAVQNMNVMLGLPQHQGLALPTRAG